MKKSSHDSVFARDEWPLNDSTQMEFSCQLISDDSRAQGATSRGVEESWIDLDHEKNKKPSMALSRHFDIIEEGELSDAVEDSDEEDISTIKRARFNVANPDKNHFDLNTSLTTILAARRSAYDSDDDESEHDCQDGSLNVPAVTTDGSQVVFMDISNASSVVSSTQLSVTRNKKRKMKRSDRSRNQADLTQGIVLISIIASLSFSAGYALGQSRRNLY